jgi:hypothetical protein
MTAPLPRPQRSASELLREKLGSAYHFAMCNQSVPRPGVGEGSSAGHAGASLAGKDSIDA